MNGQSGHLAVKHVVMGAHKFVEETNHWKQVTQNVIVSETTEKKETAQSISVVTRIFMVSRLLQIVNVQIADLIYILCKQTP